MQSGNRRFATGLNFLDRRIGGGVPAPGVVAMRAPPASQSQLFLREITSQRPLAYLSTSDPDESTLEE